ncbi:hypothetical protein PsorP6_011677 [Peronosclerospora sorghi]|uniref:Uncharacterized protein n=1 Tax=Peronosclerospora sorghi TaxID=230839 RepID=A0ACC0WN96_9STRA|nr:hypothetical protein PsorP6_011677 [Peronosclerospora sorghi]
MTNRDTRTVDKNDISTMEAALAGAVSGELSVRILSIGVTRLVAAPLDLLKIRLQVQPVRIGDGQVNLKYAGLLQAVRSIYAEEGLRSFWRGNFAATGLWVSYSALQFASYRVLTRCGDRYCDNAWIHAHPMLISVTNGAVAGVAATTATYPLDLFRTVFASQGMPKRFPTMLSFALHIWTTQGVKGFYSGLNATLFQIAPYMGLSFGMYSTLKKVTVQDCSEQMDASLDMQMSLRIALSYVGIGAVTGFLSKLAVYPLDTVKKRMQMRHVRRCETYGIIPMYTSSWTCFLDILTREGVVGLYKGTVPSVLKSVVAASATFSTYELTLRALRHVSVHKDSKGWTQVDNTRVDTDSLYLNARFR